MGYNATVVVMNDALEEIARDPEFGRKLKYAILALSLGDDPKTGRPYRETNVSAGYHTNAAVAIETHHADYAVVVSVGNNQGSVLGYAGSCDSDKEQVLRHLADKLGFSLRKKPQTRKTKR